MVLLRLSTRFGQDEERLCYNSLMAASFDAHQHSPGAMENKNQAIIKSVGGAE